MLRVCVKECHFSVCSFSFSISFSLSKTVLMLLLSFCVPNSNWDHEPVEPKTPTDLWVRTKKEEREKHITFHFIIHVTIFVNKKDEFGSKNRYRFVVDYRKLNAITTIENFPIPLIENIFSSLLDLFRLNFDHNWALEFDKYGKLLQQHICNYKIVCKEHKAN